MKMRILTISLLLIQMLLLDGALAEDKTGWFSFPENANQELPPGVPRVVETNGEVLFIDSRFTTPAFEEEGLRLVIDEANKVAAELRLVETLPITSSNLTHAFIGPFGYTYKTRKLGNITTSNYCYGVEQNFKLSDITVADHDKHLLTYRGKFYLPNSKIDTNAAYQLAVQWLSAASIDVEGLNRDCNVRIALTSDLDGMERPRGKFTPLYYIIWMPRTQMSRHDRGAYVELFLPTKTLLQLHVPSQRYILRSPVTFTNLAALFPGKAAITTNQPVEMKIMSAPDAISPSWLQHPPRQ